MKSNFSSLNFFLSSIVYFILDFRLTFYGFSDLVPQPMDVVMGRSPNANQSDPEARVEKPSEDRFSHEEHLDFEIFSQAAEATPDFFTFPGEINHVDNEQMKCQQKEVLENEREVFTEHMPNPTPESKFPDPLGDHCLIIYFILKI